MLDLLNPIFLLALLLGIKHSLDVDHVVAISSILIRSPNIRRTTTLSISWALGHMITASIITTILFNLKEKFITKLLSNFETIVAFMLILIAILTVLWEFNIISFGKHTHGHMHPDGVAHNHPVQETSENQNEHGKEEIQKLEHGHLSVLSYKGEHKVMSGIGIIHGLASNDELLLLLTVTLNFDNLFQVLVGVLIFTIGVILGMIMYGSILKFPIMKFGQDKVTRIINLTIAALTFIYAIYLLFGNAGLNLFPFL